MGQHLLVGGAFGVEVIGQSLCFLLLVRRKEGVCQVERTELLEALLHLRVFRLDSA